MSKKQSPAARLTAEEQEKILKFLRNSHFLDATGWESTQNDQKDMADSIFDVPEA